MEQEGDMVNTKLTYFFTITAKVVQLKLFLPRQHANLISAFSVVGRFNGTDTAIHGEAVVNKNQTTGRSAANSVPAFLNTKEHRLGKHKRSKRSTVLVFVQFHEMITRAHQKK